MIRQTFDLHIHPNYSDGKSSMEENIVAAIEKGLTKVGISDHAHRHIAYGVKLPHTMEYLRNAQDLKRAYKNDIEVLIGMEFDLLDLDGNIDMPKGLEKEFDIRLLGMHKATRYSNLKSFNYLILAQSNRWLRNRPTVVNANTDAFIAAIQRHKIDVLVHPNYIAKLDMGSIAKACAEQGTLLEINARHQDLSPEDVKAVLATDVKFVLGSDAHKAEQIGRHGYAEQFIETYGIDISRIVNAKHV